MGKSVQGVLNICKAAVGYHASLSVSLPETVLYFVMNVVILGGKGQRGKINYWAGGGERGGG